MKIEKKECCRGWVEWLNFEWEFEWKWKCSVWCYKRKGQLCESIQLLGSLGWLLFFLMLVFEYFPYHNKLYTLNKFWIHNEFQSYRDGFCFFCSIKPRYSLFILILSLCFIYNLSNFYMKNLLIYIHNICSSK